MKLFEFQLIEIDVNKTFSNEHTEWKIVSAEDKDEAIKLIDSFVRTFYPDPERVEVNVGLPSYCFYKRTIQLIVDSLQEVSLEKWLGRRFSEGLINNDPDIKKKSIEVKIPPISVKDMNPKEKAKFLSAMVQGAVNADFTDEGIFHLVYFVIEGGKWV